MKHSEKSDCVALCLQCCNHFFIVCFVSCFNGYVYNYIAYCYAFCSSVVVYIQNVCACLCNNLQQLNQLTGLICHHYREFSDSAVFLQTLVDDSVQYVYGE